MSNDYPLVSIIIPTYNSSDYITETLTKLEKQTYPNFEIVIVNDGSKDNSLKICEEYKNKDNRVTVIDKKNEGACIARNTGIEKAKGKYIQLVDADDYIENNMLEEQYNLAEKTNAEVVMCGMKFDIHQKNGQVVTSESHYKDMR